MARAPRRLGTPDRAQSSLLGLLLIVAFGITTTAVVVWVGATAMQTAQINADIGAAESAMTAFDAQASLVALGGSTSQRATVRAGDGDLETVPDAGWMNISIRNDSTNTTETVVLNETLGAFRYRHEETTVAYQGGGIWKRSGDGSVMVSQPEFHYEATKPSSPTLTVPLVTVRGSDPISDRVAIERERAPEAMFPVEGDPERTNPLGNGTVIITIKSDYYEAWGRFFRERTRSHVEYDHEHETARIELLIPSVNNYDSVLATTEPHAIDANPGPPPTPSKTGIDFPSADPLIESKIDECETNATACDETPPSPLTAGTYYYPSGQSGDLDIHTGGGNVTLVVNGDFEPGNVTVSGPRDVKVYVKGDFEFGGNDVINGGGDADRFTTVVHSSGDVQMNGKFRYVGFVYAPESDVALNGGGPPWYLNLKGGIVGETVDINGNPNKFEYDASIADVNLNLEADESTITYLHVSVSTVEVSGTG